MPAWSIRWAPHASAATLALSAATLALSCASPESSPPPPPRLARPVEALGWRDPHDAALREPGNLVGPPSSPLVPPLARHGGTLRQLLNTSPKRFHWLAEQTIELSHLHALMHASLAQRDVAHPERWVSQLAYRVTANADHTEYTIHLRPGVRWHTPAHPSIQEPARRWMAQPPELTAHDLKLTVEMLLHPSHQTGWVQSHYGELVGAQVLDAHTLKVRWRSSSYASLSATLMLSPSAKWLLEREEDGSLIPADQVVERAWEHWSWALGVGVGPYRLVERSPGHSLVLERVASSWGPPPPIARIHHVIGHSPHERLAMMRMGELDWMLLHATLYDKLHDKLHGQARDEPAAQGADPEPPVKLAQQRFAQLAYHYLGWNLRDPRFQDKRVRQALTLALDRQRLIDEAFLGLGELHPGPFAQGHLGHDPSIVARPFDLRAARALLDEAGWIDSDGDGVRDKLIQGRRVALAFELLLYQSPEWMRAASIYRADLRSIGVRMRPVPVSWAAMEQRTRARDFEAMTGGWGLSWEGDLFQVWHSSQIDAPAGFNHVGWRHPDSDALIEALRRTFEPQARVALQRQLHRLLHEEQPYTFIHTPHYVLLSHPRLKNMIIQPATPQLVPLSWWLAAEP